jgi:cytochrome P450
MARLRLGPGSTYVISSPELVQQILAGNQMNMKKGDALGAAKIYLGEGLLTSHGELHSRQRRLVQPLFHRAKIDEYSAGMVQAADARQRRWRDGQRFDLLTEMRLLTISVLSRSLFPAELKESEAERVTHALVRGMIFMRLLRYPGYSALRRLWFLPANRKINHAMKVFDEMFERSLEQHDQQGDDGDILSTLLDPAACGRSPEGLRQVRDEAVTMLLAGHETTATLLSFIWFSLAQTPAASERLNDELDSILEGRLPTRDDLSQLPYTGAVVNEALRLYPPVWTFGRVILTEMELNGVQMPPGTGLIVSPWVIHRSPKHYDDPLAFRPERWLDGSTADLHKYAFLPFGGGQRKCIGEGFAWTEAALVLATVAQGWSIQPTVRSLELDGGFTLMPKNGVPVIIRDRHRLGRGEEGGGSSSLPQELAARGNGDTYWDEIAPIWERGAEQRLWRRHSDAVNRRLVSRWLPEGAGAVLKTDLWDEAMGEGVYPAMASNGNEVAGIDISEEILASARDRYPGLEAHRADVRSLPFPDRRFDAVVSNSSLDHFDSQEELLLALTELHRVMKPGASLVLTLDNPANPLVGLVKALPRGALNRLWLRFGRATGKVGLLPYHVGATYGRRQLKQVLPSQGFAVEEMTTIVHAPRPLAVALAHLLEQRASPATQERYLRWLMSWERMSGGPLQYLSGHFIAVRASRL